MKVEGKEVNVIKVAQFWNPVRKKTQYCLLEDYAFWYKGQAYVIEAGFVTDWASVPEFLWSIFHPTGKHDSADLEHDYLYDNRISTRKEVDMYFFKRMLQCGLSYFNAWCRYAGVRIGGRKWWNN